MHSAVSVLVVAQSSLEILEGLMNNPVYLRWISFGMRHCIAGPVVPDVSVDCSAVIIWVLQNIRTVHPTCHDIPEAAICENSKSFG